MPDSTKFSFTLNNVAITSAGVFAADGKLIKTLWSGIKYNAGTHTESWDGTDDEGRLVTGSGYKVRVLSGNVNYTWEGVIGNTSESFTGPTVHHAMRRIYSMAISGNTAYYATYYNEAASSTFKFNTASPQKKTTIFNKGISVQFVATDGTNVYWAGIDTAQCFVYATNTSNDKVIDFSAGTDIKLDAGKKSISAVDAGRKSLSSISGLAVQGKGRFLFVSHQQLNELHVLDKRSGLLLQTLSFANPQSLAVDSEDNLWMIYSKDNKKIVEKFAVNTNGSLSSLKLILQNITDPLAIAVSPDNTTLLVADGGISQQIKAFNNNSGSPLWVYGKMGGYTNDPEVSNDKFYFDEEKNKPATFIAFQPDGSFWVGDTGNDRVQHFSAGRKFIDRIMYRSISYSLFVDPNNPSRVFSDYLEFHIDYSKPLAPDNGSWTLVRNWGKGVPAYWDDKYNRLRCVTTLSNGRTYALLHHSSASGSKRKWSVVELPTNGDVRFTGIELPNDNSQLYPDGSIRKVSKIVLGKPTAWSRKNLKGFDRLNNPVWDKEAVIASSPPATRNDPLYWGNSNTLRSGEITSSGILISFDGGLTPNGSDGWHLGAIKTGDTNWLWRTAFSTHKDYRGPYPTDGSYDNGNNVKYAGSVALVSDRNIIWGYHGEFWKNSQVNKWTHVYDDGLFVGQFGITGPEVTAEEAAAGMAGNAFAASLVKDSNGNMYLYHNDESYHGGIHRWKITGLNTIKEQVIPAQLPPAVHGLTAQYYNKPDLNNINIKTTRIDSNISLNWSGKSSFNTDTLNTDSFSVSWKGFIQPLYSSSYTFFTPAKGDTRLWIDGKLLAAQDKDEKNTEKNASIDLVADKRYAIRLEYSGQTSDACVALLWSVPGQQKEIIPSSQLYASMPPDRSEGFDLMEDLPYNSKLENNGYGWKKYPADEDITDRYKKWWTVRTNIKKYKKSETPDVYARFRQQSGIAYIARNIASDKPVNNWKLYGIINYEGNYVNMGSGSLQKDSGGSFFEVLDENEKIITRIFLSSDNEAGVQRMNANSKAIVQTTAAKLKPVTGTPQPFSIHVTNAVATIKYGSYPSVTTTVFDSLANWRKPMTVRLYFWGNGSNYDRIIDIEKMLYQPY